MRDSYRSGRVSDHLDPPAPFRRSASGVLKLTKGGGAISFFGAPFLLAGLFMLLGAAAIFPEHIEAGGSRILIVPMGLVFSSVGALMVFGRQWLVLDLGRRSILRQFGLLVPLHTHERPLSEFCAVVISHDPGDSESSETYPVTLRAIAGRDAAIVKPLKFAESIATAEYLAGILSIQLIDTTTDRETIFSPEHAGESLRDRLSRETAVIPPERPSAMRSVVTESGGETRIVLAGGGPTLAGYAGLILPIIVFFIAMIVATPFVFRSAKPLTLLCMLLVLFGAPVVFWSIRFMIGSRRKGLTVTASLEGLTIGHAGNSKRQTTVIPTREILDVVSSTFESAAVAARRSPYFVRAQSPGDERTLRTLRRLVPNAGIVIKSRNGLITVGEGLSTEELEYIAWLIRRALV